MKTNCRTFFFTEKVTQAIYIPGHVGTVLHSTALEDIPNILFHLDSAPSHFLWMCGIVWLNIFGFDVIRWIRRDRPIGEPARSPDLIPFDFFMWSVMKDKTCHTKIHSLNEPKEKLREEFLHQSRDILENTWTDLDHCLNIVWASQARRLKTY